jgi:L-ascorbate metabolism protein UlaG (beta-lactamase superfamily)
VSAPAVTWWGHASTTVELGATRVATDPLLANRLYHLRRHGPRPPAAAADADLVLVSHLHADHLHRPSLHRFGAEVPLVVPRGAEELLPGRALHPVSPGDVIELAGVRVEVLAAAHDGRRAPGSRHRGPALGFRVSGEAGSFWFPGDTGSAVDLVPVAPVDLALVPVGGWGPTLGDEHLDPQQAAAAVARVGARWAVPVHWGTFWPIGLERLDRRTHHRLFVTPGARFASALRVDAPATEAVVVAPGERVVR